MRRSKTSMPETSMPKTSMPKTSMQGPVDFATLRLSAKPNQFLVLPPGFVGGSKPHARSAILTVAPDRLAQAWLSLLAAEPRIELAEHYDDRRQYRFVARSAWLRFPDDVWVQVDAAGDGRATFAVYSRSRYGGYDFGVNRKRVETWMRRLGGHLGASITSQEGW